MRSWERTFPGAIALRGMGEILSMLFAVIFPMSSSKPRKGRIVKRRAGFYEDGMTSAHFLLILGAMFIACGCAALRKKRLLLFVVLVAVGLIILGIALP